ncbi:hypothetical protein H920_12900 [Fukomys damarensis]|uniref:Uncharacterized protein n=1 Tax=Fukomys damarensis TaxID=885580 RepID=A0A091D105_FUKDA|nr:hypothetical protein H920_12900 [Fukomys damarensis]
MLMALARLVLEASPVLCQARRESWNLHYEQNRGSLYSPGPQVWRRRKGLKEEPLRPAPPSSSWQEVHTVLRWSPRTSGPSSVQQDSRKL